MGEARARYLPQDEALKVEEDVHERDDARQDDRVAHRAVGVVGRKGDEALACMRQALGEADREEHARLLGIVRGQRAQRRRDARVVGAAGDEAETDDRGGCDLAIGVVGHLGERVDHGDVSLRGRVVAR